MPNWCYNMLTVRGDKKRLEEFDSKFKASHTNYYGGQTSVIKDKFDLKKYAEYVDYRLTPYNNQFMTAKEKEERYEVNYISEIVTEEGYSLYNFVPMSKDDFLNGWYKWNVDNLGTKWDINNGDINVSKSDEEYYYSFETAWSPCEPAVLAMSKAFPDLIFTHGYEESGMCFAGLTTYSEGAEIEREEAESYRRFVVEHFGYEYPYKCASCGYPIDEYEYDEEHECPECNSDNLVEV